jgi:hypothetical protein
LYFSPTRDSNRDLACFLIWDRTAFGSFELAKLFFSSVKAGSHNPVDIVSNCALLEELTIGTNQSAVKLYQGHKSHEFW